MSGKTVAVARLAMMLNLAISSARSAIPGLAVPCQAPGKICLFGGDRLSGNVLLGGRPVCDDRWSIEDATVACRNLGHARATKFTNQAFFGQMGSNFAMDDVEELASILLLAFIKHFNTGWW